MTAGRAPRTIGLGVVLTLLLTSVAFLASATVFAVWSGAQVSHAQDGYIVAASTLAAQEQAKKEARALVAAENEERNVERRRLRIADETAVDLGFTVVSSGFYYKFGEWGECTAEANTCANFTVMTGDACAGGVTVTVAMYMDRAASDAEVSLGSVYGRTAALPAGGVAELSVEMLPDSGVYSIIEAVCTG